MMAALPDVSTPATVTVIIQTGKGVRTVVIEGAVDVTLTQNKDRFNLRGAAPHGSSELFAVEP